MSEKTPNQIGEEAAKNVAFIQLKEEQVAANPQWAEHDKRMEASGFVPMNLPPVEDAVKRSKDHYEDNKAAYQDLAAVEAHLDGVKLNVDHPLHQQDTAEPEETSTYDFEAAEEKYQAEIAEVTKSAHELLEERGVKSIAMTSAGVDDLEGDAAAIRDEIFKARLDAGYELSYSQLCNGIYAGAQELGILSDQQEQRQ
ncbi:MAG: hypothetical protein U0524_03265 [Candidatus Saccharimonadales bacterium]